MKILFVCVHNAGRSQMAEAFARAIAKDRGISLEVESAGTLGGGSINPVVAEAMREVDVPLEGHFPKALTQEMANSADEIISMGCGVDADACPAKFLVTEDWGLDDPAGLPIERVRPIRDQIRMKVEEMLEKIAESHGGAGT
ncbi:MAG TPA: arsenate reductase ArsC [Fimbriimonas sp.]|nr:arsenate reductase ArsC [Fimbriimonas sp.]